jgi:hypothetical protein
MESKLLSTLEYLLSAFAGVVARAVVEPSRDIESLPLAALAVSGCSASGTSCGGGSRRLSLASPRGTPSKNDGAGVEELLESLLAESFQG